MQSLRNMKFHITIVVTITRQDKMDKENDCTSVDYKKEAKSTSYWPAVQNIKSNIWNREHNPYFSGTLPTCTYDINEGRILVLPSDRTGQ